MFEMIHMALGNIRRRALRNSLTVVGLAVFVMIFVLITSFTFTVQSQVSKSLSDLGGEITLWSQGALLPFFGEIPENYTAQIEQIAYVENVSPQIARVSSVDSQDLRLVFGLNPLDIPVFYSYTMVEGTMISTNESKAVLGCLFADFLKKHRDDNITIDGHVMPVVGVFKTDTWMDNVVIIPFSVAQDDFSLSGRVSIIMVTVTDPAQLDFVVSEIRMALPDVSVSKSQEAASRLAPLMSSISLVSYTFSTIAGIACFFGITNVMLTGIIERGKEIGILKALGASGGDVTRMMLYESAALGGVGGFLGCSISIAIFLQGMILPITSASLIAIQVFPEVFLYGFILSIAISTLASLYPVWRAVRVRPHEVLKFG
jgi:putative ABC transport system permease protein